MRPAALLSHLTRQPGSASRRTNGSTSAMSVSNRRFIATSIIFTAILSIGIAISGCGFDRVVKAQSKPDVKKEQFTKIVNDTTTETGKIYFLRTGSTTQSGAKLNPPDARTFEYKNGLLRLFTPGTNHIDQYSAGAANQSRYEAFLSPRFRGNGSDLAKAWAITDQGTEQNTDRGKPVSLEKLDLVSKGASERNNYTHITIWVDPVRDVSLKQVFFDVSGDTNSAIYSKIRLNQSIDLKTYAIKCQGKCS